MWFCDVGDGDNILLAWSNKEGEWLTEWGAFVYKMVSDHWRENVAPFSEVRRGAICDSHLGKSATTAGKIWWDKFSMGALRHGCARWWAVRLCGYSVPWVVVMRNGDVEKVEFPMGLERWATMIQTVDVWGWRGVVAMVFWLWRWKTWLTWIDWAWW